MEEGDGMKKRILSNSKHVYNNNSGSTMIETIVSFVIILIVLAALYGMVRFSSNLRMRATDTADIRNSFGNEIYKKTPDDSVEVSNYLGKRADNIYMFSLTPDLDSTDVSNLSTESEINIDIFGQSIRLPNIDASGYVSVDPRIKEENLVTPKIISFSFFKGPYVSE
ncbi:MAG: prepilin-type N-terminal cleavage/methylation domain-containing protein [Eubacterium sp.]|nr:prepilin-type N-terminal cleavage/methylation domain-containing protein [Eubacterium sp.]